jgi:hypothetical protein
MSSHHVRPRWVIVLVALTLSVAVAWTSAAAEGTVKVFIYAGQSNAQGKAPIAIAEAQAEAPATKYLYKHLRKDGKWIVRDDVFFRYASQGPQGTQGPLRIGMGSWRFGADHEFASMMGDRFEEPVVIVKSAFGGASLCQSFRPPSAGLPSDEKLQAQLAGAQARAKAINERDKKNDPLPMMDDIKKLYGGLYRQILADYKEVTENGETMFPELKGKKPELTGFVWFQGWNDQYGGQDEYASNMKHFIKDIRKDLAAPNLPFVIVAMGQNGSTPAAGAILTIREAQMAMNDVPEFQGNVKAFRSDLLVDKDAERLMTQKDSVLRARDRDEVKKFAADDGYHYYGSPIWYMRIGHAAGEAMLELLGKQPGR